ncbi:MAG: RrF2 family transcriptional regulator [Gaiellales bacterium]
MRLRFSRAADYGLRAVIQIARAPDGELVTRLAVARAVNAPPSVLAQALASLVRSGLLIAQAGPRGGYRLARPAADIPVLEVVTAIDGEERNERCVLRDGACNIDNPCPFHTFFAHAKDQFQDALRTTTLADVLAAAQPPSG